MMSDTDSDNDTGRDRGEAKARNISTEHQQPGDARKPKDTLDRDQGPGEDDGGRKTSLTRDE